MTAAAPFPSEGRRPLGEVLVARGIVTPEQLTAALDQQRSTGRPLGEIIVALGFAPGPIVAQALATQHGGLIKTEYGFATGWSNDAVAPVAADAPIDASELAERDRTIAEFREWAEKARAAISSRDDAIARLRAAHEEALDALRSDLTAQREETAAARAELEADSVTAAQLEQQAAELARLQAALGELENGQGAAERELAAARRTNVELERRLQNARSRADTLARRVAEQEEELEAFRAQVTGEANRWASASTHYVLRRGSTGYDLVAHDGPPPAVGDTVDGLRVARVAPVLPGFEVPCVHLAD